MYHREYIDNVQNLTYVVTPSSKERTMITSIGAIVNGGLRSLMMLLFPILAMLTGGVDNVNTYRLFVPIFSVISITLGFLIAGAKERVVQEREHKPKVKFWITAKAVMKNKYFWIINVSGVIFTWNAVYVSVSMLFFMYIVRLQWVAGIVGSVAGILSTPANILTPIMVKKFGLRGTFVFCRLMVLLMFGFLLIGVLTMNVAVYVIALFLIPIFTTPPNNLSKVYTSIVWDYQQLKSGERLDGFIGGLSQYIATPIVMLSGFLLPILFRYNGLTSDWAILFDAEIARTIFSIHIIISGLSIGLSAIPYIFFDIDVKQHQEIIAELKSRVAEDKLSDGV
jgi:Na+/melibiose symporter-like transporter